MMLGQGFVKTLLGSQLRLGVLLGSLAFFAQADISFGQWGPPSALEGTFAESDTSDDLKPDVAVNGSNTWVAVWQTPPTAETTFAPAVPRFDTPSQYSDVVFSTSSNGVDWNQAAFIDSVSGDNVNDSNPRIAESGGTFVVVWERQNGATPTIRYATGNGSSWTINELSAPSGADANWYRNPAVAGSATGGWMIVSGGARIFTHTSSNGMTWNAGATALGSSTVSYADPVVAYDLHGWVVAATEIPATGPRQIVAASSPDGSLWSSVAVTNAPVPTGIPAIQNGKPSLAADGFGKVVLVWQSVDSLGGTVGQDGDILFSVSTNGGRNWTPRSPVSSDAATDAVGDINPDITTDFKGSWVVTWERSGEGIGAAVSQTNGASWISRSYISATGTTPAIGTNGSSRWGILWSGVLPDTGTDREIVIAYDTIQSTADLKLELFPPLNGSAYTCGWFQIDARITNLGPMTATGGVYTNDMSSVSQISSITSATVDDGNGTCTISGKIVVCDLANIPKDRQFWARIRATANVTGDADVTGTVALRQFDPAADNNTSSAHFSIGDQAVDLKLTGQLDPSPVTQGQQLTISSIVNNLSGAATSSTVFTQTLPPQFVVLSASPTQGTCTTGTGVVICDLGYLDALAAASVDVVVLPTSPGNFSIQGSVTHSIGECNPTDNSYSLPIEVISSEVTDLEIKLLPLTTESIYTCTVQFPVEAQITNLGPLDATGVNYSARFDPNFSVVDANSTKGDCNIVGAQVNCAIGDLDVDSTAIVTVNLHPLLAGPHELLVTVSGDQADTITLNNSDTTEVEVLASADVELTTTFPDPIYNEMPLLISSVIRNNGSDSARNVIYTQYLPPSVEFVSADYDQCNLISTPQAPNAVQCNIGTLAYDEAVTITISTIPHQESPPTFPTIGYVESDTYDCTPENNFLRTELNVKLTPADLKLVNKVASPNPAVKGSLLSYTITIQNAGPGTAKQVKVEDALDLANVTFVSAGVSQGSYIYVGGKVIANLGSIPVDNPSTPRNEGLATVTIAVRPFGWGPTLNSASVSALNDDLVPTNNTFGPISTPIIQKFADVSITNTASASTVFVGTSLKYHLVAQNNGVDIATQVWVHDVLPETVYIVQSSSSQGIRLTSGNILSWSVGTLQPGASATMDVEVLPRVGGVAKSTASIEAYEPDPYRPNNVATVSTNVLGSGAGRADIEVVKTASVSAATPNSDFNYVLTVKNNGPNSANSIRVVDPLPDGISFVSGSSTQGRVTADGQNVLGEIGTLPPGGSATVTITVKAGSVDGLITNTATALSNMADAYVDNNVSSVDVTISSVGGGGAVDMQLTGWAWPNPVATNNTVQFYLTLRNNGPGEATNAGFTFTVPPEMDFISAASAERYCTASGNTVTCYVGTMAPTRAVEVIINANARTKGKSSAWGIAWADQSDSLPDSNNLWISVDTSDSGGKLDGPDLTGQWLAISRSASGKRVTVRGALQIRNEGNKPVKKAVVEYWLSDDEYLNDGDLRLGQRAAGAYKPGQARNRSVRIRLPFATAAGRKHIIAVIRTADRSVDAKMDNNYLPSPEILEH